MLEIIFSILAMDNGSGLSETLNRLGVRISFRSWVWRYLHFLERMEDLTASLKEILKRMRHMWLVFYKTMIFLTIYREVV
jgi:hypothetical protein